MMQLNKVGEALGKLACVSAMTDITGFGLLGHLTEMAEGSSLSAVLNMIDIPLITEDIFDYIAKGSVPGGTGRNIASYGHKIATLTDIQIAILADPQTSGGLLIAVAKENANQVVHVLHENGLGDFAKPIGYFKTKGDKVVEVI